MGWRHYSTTIIITDTRNDQKYFILMWGRPLCDMNMSLSLLTTFQFLGVLDKIGRVKEWWRNCSTTDYDGDTKSLFNTLWTLPCMLQKRELKKLDSKTLKTAPQLRSCLKKNLLKLSPSTLSSAKSDKYSHVEVKKYVFLSWCSFLRRLRRAVRLWAPTYARGAAGGNSSARWSRIETIQN